MKSLRVFVLLCALVVLSCTCLRIRPLAQLLDKQKLLDAQTFWDNRDWDWYKEQHPVLRVPRRRHQHDLLLPLGAGHQASDLRLAQHRLHVHRVHRPAVLVGHVRGDQLPGRASALRGPLAATSRDSPATTRATGSAPPARSRGATAPGWPTPSGPSTRCIPDQRVHRRTCCPTW